MNEQMTPARFKQIRSTLGLTQIQLARRLRLDPISISRKERGVQGITTTDAARMNALAGRAK